MKNVIVQIVYSQLAIFNRQMEKPLNSWTSKHVQQGFSWREGSVSFRTLEEDCEIVVEINLVPKFPPVDQNSVQVIDVPFSIGSHGIEVGSVITSEVVLLPMGEYELRIELLDGSRRARLWFANREDRRFRVVKLNRTSELPTNLALTTVPA